MNYENQQICDALNLRLTPYNQTDDCTWDVERELRYWSRFFAKNPTRVEVLEACCADMNGRFDYSSGPQSRVSVNDAFVDNQIALHYAFAPSEIFDNRFEAELSVLSDGFPNYTPVLGHEQAFELNPVFAGGVQAIRQRLAHHLPCEPETYALRFAAGIRNLHDLMLAEMFD